MRYSWWTINNSKQEAKRRALLAYSMKRFIVITDEIKLSCSYGNSIHRQELDKHTVRWKYSDYLLNPVFFVE